MASQYDDVAPELLVECRGPVRVLTMNAPERLNAVNERLHRALAGIWDRLVDDTEARAVVITGAGRAFSAGGDAAHVLNLVEDVDLRRRDFRTAERLVRAMIECELPVVAAVNGPAVGFGASVAMLCDLVVMGTSAFLSDPHVNVGVVAGDGGAVAWPHHTSLLRVKEHLLLGDRISAAECVRIGLANRVVDDDQVMPTALDFAERLAALPPQAVRDTKRALNASLRQSANSVLPFGLAAETVSYYGPEIREFAETLQTAAARKKESGER